ncbi:MAG: insulinase family protein [Deltaproteobacteria bacterium]|nr:insulinase family protein [Candidatus Zymogenaceae bacterium]
MNRYVRYLPIILSLFLIVLAASPAAATDVEKYTLPNGLTVILAPDPSSFAVAMNVWVGVGSFDEDPEQSGIAHFTEHLLFKGSDTLGPGEGAAVIEACGGFMNAHTSLDCTVIDATVSSRFLETMIAVVADHALFATFPEDEVDRERLVVLEEICMINDDPGRTHLWTHFADAFVDHPYSRPILGTSEIVSSITRDELYRFYRTHYVPENMVVVLAGDFDTKEAKELIKTYFGATDRDGAPDKQQYDNPMNSGLVVDGLNERVEIARLIMGFNIPPITDDDLYALDVSSHIVGDGTGSRLYRRLVDEERLAYGVDTYSYTPNEAGLFMVTASLESAHIPEAVELIIREMRGLVIHPVTDTELEAAKTAFFADFIYGKETVEGIAESLGFFESALGDVSFEKKYLGEVTRLTDRDITSVADRYFTRDNLTITFMLPPDESVPEMIDAVTGAVDAAFEGGEAPVVAVEEPILEEGPLGYRVVLPNGAVLVIREDHDLEVVAVIAAFNGGGLSETKETNGVSNMLALMWDKGTEDDTARALTERADDIAGSFYGFSGRNTFGLKGEFLSMYDEEGFDLFFEMLLSPSFDTDELEKIREKVIAGKKVKDEDPFSVVATTFREALYNGHSYGFTIEGELENIRDISREDLIAYYEHFVVPSNMVIAVSGDVDPEKILSDVMDAIGDMPASEKPVIERTEPSPPRSPVRVSKHMDDKEQTHLLIGFLTAPFTSEDSYPLEVLSMILSGHGGRLFVALREEQGLAYSVHAFSQGGVDPGFFAVYIATAPKNEKTAADGMMEELSRIKNEPVTEEELLRAQVFLVGQHDLGLQANIDMATSMALNELYGFGYDFDLQYGDKIMAVSIDDIRNVGERYLDFKSLVEVTVGP